MRRIGVLTSGGDAPGMNAAVMAVAKAARYHNMQLIGIKRGYNGTLMRSENPADDMTELDLDTVLDIADRPGTYLRTARCLDFLKPEMQQRAANNIREMGIEGIVVIGGDGSYKGALALCRLGIPCVGLPGTIDNDITSTDETIGFDTAMNTVIEMVDRLRDTCESHARSNVVEVMGRGAGDIALNTAIASGATAVAIPEIPFDEDAVIEKMKQSKMLGKRNFIIIVSEGVGHEFGPALTEKIEAVTGIETRFARLAHVVRGGTPTLRDRVLSSRMGEFAVKQLLEGRSDIVICLRNNEIVATDINYALVLDRMYKGKLKDGDLAPFTEEQIAEMRAFCEEKRSSLVALYQTSSDLNL